MNSGRFPGVIDLAPFSILIPLEKRLVERHQVAKPCQGRFCKQLKNDANQA
jgi:hypothetical protein